jgi:hypothetical protein
VTSAASSVAAAAASSLRGALNSAGFYGMGANVAASLAEGMRSGIDRVRAAAQALADAANSGVRNRLGIHSPSRVGLELGANFGGSMADGMEDQTERVARAAETLARAAENDARAEYRGGYAGYMAGAGGGYLIDYDMLADAVARANEAAGLGNAVVAMDKRIVGETIEPYSSRAGLLRGQRSVKGRANRMIMS